MRYLVAVLSLLLLFEIFDAAPSSRRLRKRYRPRGRYRKSDFRNQGPANPTHLVGPDGESFYRGLDLNQEPGALISPSGGSPGSPVPSYIRTQRSQVAGDFGHNPVPPGSVPPGSIISIGSNIPPDPNLEPQIAEGIEQMDMDEREAIALVSHYSYSLFVLKKGGGGYYSKYFPAGVFRTSQLHTPRLEQQKEHGPSDAEELRTPTNR